jgi:hypothetical protein
VFDRRDFVKIAATASASVALGRLPRSQLASAGPRGEPNPPPSWIDKPMRWAQLTLVEDDPGKFDLQFWLDCRRFMTAPPVAPVFFVV